MIGEFNYFPGLQIKQLKDGIFICQSKYTKELLKKFDMEKAKPYSIPMSPYVKLDLDKGGKKVKVTLFRGMLVAFSILLLVGLILCLMCACVLIFNLILRNLN